MCQQLDAGLAASRPVGNVSVGLAPGVWFLPWQPDLAAASSTWEKQTATHEVYQSVCWQRTDGADGTSARAN